MIAIKCFRISLKYCMTILKGIVTWNAIQNQNFILIIFCKVVTRINILLPYYILHNNKTLPNYVPHEILLMIIEETCHKTFVLTFTTIRFVIKQLLCRLEVSTTVVHSEQEQFSWKGKLILPVIVAMASGR